MYIHVTSKCVCKYCVNVLADWLSDDVVRCYDDLKIETCYDAKTQR